MSKHMPPKALEPLTVELRLPTTIRAVFGGLEEGDPSGLREVGTLKVFGQIALQGHLVELAAFFVEPHPEPAAAGGRCRTRARPKVVRVACPWLIRRFIDPGAVFLFVSPSEVPSVADRFHATPFDID